MARIAVHKVQETFSDTLSRVIDKRERIVLHHRGKNVAAIIPAEDLDLLEELEDRLDIVEALKILDDPDSEFVPWKRAKDELKP